MATTQHTAKRLAAYFIAAFTTIFLLWGAYGKHLPTTPTEVWGFLTGALCVYLLVRQNIYNWPASIVNAAIYGVVFFDARLFADMSLQVVYIILGFGGWLWWVTQKQDDQTKMRLGELTKTHAALIGLVAVAVTYIMHIHLVNIHDSAPWLDAITTSVSLAATYLQIGKYWQSWYLWIGVDLIYIPLYVSRHLPLTAVLYVVFLILSIMGAIAWSREKKAQIEPHNLTGELAHV